MQRMKDNTFFHNVREDKKDRLEVEIGDAKQEAFFPQVKIKRFDNEVNLSIRYKHEGKGKESHEWIGEKCIWKQGKAEAHIYPIEDGYEIEAILNEKPKINVVEFTLETKGLDFFYQPELTEEEKAKGFERPENVIGSYAVYTSERKKTYKTGKQYKTGKIGHIYRPLVTDSNSKSVWGEMNIANGILSVTIPQVFLDSASYPVIVDPTFGYDTVGGSTAVAGSAAGALGNLYNTLVAVTGDVVTGVSFYAEEANDSENITTGIYTVSGGELDTRVGTTGSVNVNSGTGQWWNTTLSATLTNGVEYGVAYGSWDGGVGNEHTRIFYDSGSSGDGSMNDGTSLPATWDELSNSSFIFSIYATYEHAPVDVSYTYNIFIDKGKL